MEADLGVGVVDEWSEDGGVADEGDGVAADGWVGGGDGVVDGFAEVVEEVEGVDVGEWWVG